MVRRGREWCVWGREWCVGGREWCVGAGSGV